MRHRYVDYSHLPPAPLPTQYIPPYPPHRGVVRDDNDAILREYRHIDIIPQPGSYHDIHHQPMVFPPDSR